MFSLCFKYDFQVFHLLENSLHFLVPHLVFCTSSALSSLLLAFLLQDSLPTLCEGLEWIGGVSLTSSALCPVLGDWKHRMTECGVGITSRTFLVAAFHNWRPPVPLVGFSQLSCSTPSPFFNPVFWGRLMCISGKFLCLREDLHQLYFPPRLMAYLPWAFSTDLHIRHRWWVQTCSLVEGELGLFMILAGQTSPSMAISSLLKVWLDLLSPSTADPSSMGCSMPGQPWVSPMLWRFQCILQFSSFRFPYVLSSFRGF